MQKILNFNASPTHIMALLKAHTKLVTYNYWEPDSTQVTAAGRGVEFYDLSTPGGSAETDNRSDDPRVAQQLEELYSELLPNEIRRPMPPSLRVVQAQQEKAWIAYADLVDNLSDEESKASPHLSVGGRL